MFYLGDNRLKVRKASLKDIDQIWEVEKASFQTPWSRESFSNELTQNKFAYYYVVEMEKEIVGYGGMWVIFDEAHITNVAIHPKARGKKLGELIMRHLIFQAKFYGATSMTLEVRKSNYVARALYNKLNFEQQGIRINYYADTMEDAIIMWVKL